jgi:hypothetical protein
VRHEQEALRHLPLEDPDHVCHLDELARRRLDREGPGLGSPARLAQPLADQAARPLGTARAGGTRTDRDQVGEVQQGAFAVEATDPRSRRLLGCTRGDQREREHGPGEAARGPG